MSDPPVVRLRPLTDDDLPMMHRWLNSDGVAQWWEGDDTSWDGVVADYGSDGRDPGEHWIGQREIGDGSWQPIGWIQAWQAVDYPEATELWGDAATDPGLWGIDYLIGEPDLRGQGYGTAMIAAMVDELFGRPDPPAVIGSDPALANRNSWRALERAGFRRADVIEFEPHGPYQLMRYDFASWITGHTGT